MHIVTFYSFKGGVGRTMALVNVAAELANRGKRVLVVDFDLEAPGIQTYRPFNGSSDALGVVDYVTKYVETGVAPDVRNYISKHELNGNPICLMGAGRQDSAYARRLNAIDWASLYRDHDGYLMFEDLKQQWNEQLDVDYVLIDSRTGHTDVGGICTRQLPDAAVLLFFPNDQNLLGLTEVVQNIRAESKTSRTKNVYLHFCPSNVPDMDDEEQILWRYLEKAKQKLAYQAPSSVIHHYNSLALLDQLIFVFDRPMTRLAAQYRNLVDAIVAQNLEDRSGAIAKLDQIRREVRQERFAVNLEALRETLSKIYKYHPKDGEIAWSLSLVYELLGDLEAQLDALNNAIVNHFKEARARSKRVVLLRGIKPEILIEDLRAIILDAEASSSDLVFAIARLHELGAFTPSVLEQSPAISKQMKVDPVSITNALMFDRQGCAVAARLLFSNNRFEVKRQAQIALIGAGDFTRACQMIGSRADVLISQQVADVFNLACAEWGLSSFPPKDLFARVASLAEDDDLGRGPNYWQCISLANFVIGNIEAAELYLQKAKQEIEAMPPIPVFSCWRYLNIRKNEFMADLEAMRDQAKYRKASLLPQFIEEPRLLVN